MREFFNGWRRKVGCALLVIACLLTSAWIRSKHTQEAVSFRLAYQGQVFYSASGSVYWWTIPTSQIKTSEWPQWHRSLPNNLLYDGIRIKPQLIMPFGVEFPDSHYFTQSMYYRQRIRAMAFPYWPLVIPLAVLSAYLIFWKPRKRPI